MLLLLLLLFDAAAGAAGVAGIVLMRLLVARFPRMFMMWPRLVGDDDLGCPTGTLRTDGVMETKISYADDRFLLNCKETSDDYEILPTAETTTFSQTSSISALVYMDGK